MNGLAGFFSSAGLLPHGYCILWRPDILALHVISDAIIAAAYFSIPLAIFAFLRQRADLVAEHRRVAALFCAFILGCGMTHVMAVVVLWYPIYAVDGLIKALTAAVSIVTAVMLWPMIPGLLKIPSPSALALANARLQAEGESRLRALGELETIRASLEAEVARRTREVRALASRFEIATEGSAITVSEQDEELRYTWLHNPRTPLSAAAMGLSDREALEPSSADVLEPLKRRVLATGEPTRADVALGLGDDVRHFDMKITPAELEGRGRGLLVASVDITEQKRQQDRLQVITRELAHRAKNLLAMVDGMARQTARAEGLPDAFVRRFGDRLAALGAAHDLLIGRDWEGVDLRDLADSQIGHLAPEAGNRIAVGGPRVVLRPEAAQYLALALHELATNAVKHGVLGPSGGTLNIGWRINGAGAERQVELEWIETGEAVAPPPRNGFGRLLLETLVPRALRGNAALEFGATGVAWKILFEA